MVTIVAFSYIGSLQPSPGSLAPAPVKSNKHFCKTTQQRNFKEIKGFADGLVMPLKSSELLLFYSLQNKYSEHNRIIYNNFEIGKHFVLMFII